MQRQELQTKAKVMVSSGVGIGILTAYMLVIISTAILMGLFK